MSLTPTINIALKKSVEPQVLTQNLQEKLKKKGYNFSRIMNVMSNWPGKGKIPNSNFDLDLEKWGIYSQMHFSIYPSYISCGVSDSISLEDLLYFVNSILESLAGDIKFIYGQWGEGMQTYQDCVQKKNKLPPNPFPSEYFDFDCLIETNFWFFYFDKSLLSKSQLLSLEDFSKREHKIEYFKDGLFVVHRNFFEYPERSMRYFQTGDGWKKGLKKS